MKLNFKITDLQDILGVTAQAYGEFTFVNNKITLFYI